MAPQMQQGYQPAPSYSLNGYTPVSSAPGTHPPPQGSPFQPFPTPAPSSALSEERSTSHGPQGQQFTSSGQLPYLGSLAQSYTNHPLPAFEGQPMMAGLFPSTNQQQSLHQQLASAAQQYGQAPQGQLQQFGQNAMASDPWERATAAVNGSLGEIDWSIFDQYIFE
jgi:hypothetical protein